MGIGVAVVQPNAAKRTELGGGGEARGGTMHDRAVLLETRQQRTGRRSRNPRHGLGFECERRGLGLADPDGQEGGGVEDELVNVLHGGGRRRNRRMLVAA